MGWAEVYTVLIMQAHFRLAFDQVCGNANCPVSVADNVVG